MKTGTVINQYKIISPIGKGGMGEVFLAQDTKLNRKVAIKFLNDEFSRESEKLNRFVQEAQATSALNHPNILTVYGIDSFEGSHYIATEFIEGETLRESLSQKESIPLNRILKIGIQVAESLSAAHSAGIAHRDIKPENIMIRQDGYVKVLDFGLAKLTEKRETDISLEGETKAHVKTNPGVVMGTVSYMSPEQAQGKSTNELTDIWSLGVVLYELLAGKVPFVGKTINHTIVSIIETEPKLLENVPDELQRIVRKTLTKDVEMRYQTARDLLIDLKNLRRTLDIQGELERSIVPIREATTGLAQENATQIYTEKSIEETKTEVTKQTQNATNSSSLEYAVTKVKQNKFSTVAVFAIAAVVLAGFGYGLYSFLSKPKTEQSRTVAELKTQRLTGDGKTSSAVISPDGKFLAYKRVENEKESLWVKQIQTNSNIQVVQAGEFTDIGGLAFAPDGNFVFFNGAKPGGDRNTIYKVPTLGGAPTKFLSNTFGLAFSADGKQIAYLGIDPAATKGVIMVANADGSNERKLASFSGDLFLDSRPAWSPDGKTIAVSLGDRSLWPEPGASVGVISTTDGSFSKLGNQKWTDLNSMVWTSSGDAVLAVEEGAIVSGQIWEVAFPSGEARRLTNTFTRYGGISITADGKSISLIESETRSGVWVSPNTDPNAAKQILPANGEIRGIAWAPDGRIVYVSDQSGDSEIWSMNADGSNAKQLTNDRVLKQQPVVSPDGRYVVYSASGLRRIFRIEIGGGAPVQLNPDGRASSPDISPDSKWVLYNAVIDDRTTIVRVPIGGGEPQRLYEGGTGSPRYSPDGKYFACGVREQNGGGRNRIAIFPADGGEPVRMIDLSVSNFPYPWSLAWIWTPDGKGFVYRETKGERMNLWAMPLDGGQPKQITNFDPPVVMQAAYSRDGKQAAIIRGETTSNAVLMTGFR